MKKLLLLLSFCTLSAFAQDDSKNPMGDRNNEFRIDVLSPIAFGKANISYERFLSDRWSVGITGSFAFSDKVDKDFDKGYRNTLPKTEIVPHVRYRLSESFGSYYFVEGFVSANSGDHKEITRVTDGTDAYYTINKESYFDLAVGGAIGYKVYFVDSIVLEVLVGAGYNLIEPDHSPNFVSRLGINLGYRF